MDSLSRAEQLPAQRLDAAGRAHVDQRAVIALALPLMANSAVQIVLNLTDMWFMGRISTKALAAVGAVQWLVIVAGAGRGRAGPRGADAGGAEFGCAPLPARGPGGMDRVVGDGLRGAAVRAGGRRAPPDSRAVRVRSAGRAAR